MDYLSDERVKWTKEGATISLMEPVKYADDKYDKVFIKHMNGKVYRKYPDNLSPDDLISMAADLFLCKISMYILVVYRTNFAVAYLLRQII